jgi:hypothetical protein
MRAHMTGTFIVPAVFNHKSTWNTMQDFYRILGRLREHHWVQALDFNSLVETEHGADESSRRR